MSSRDSILEKLKQNKPDYLDLPLIDSKAFDEKLDLIAEFTKKVELVGGNVVNVTNTESIKSYLKGAFSDFKTNYSTIEDFSDLNTFTLDSINTPHDLEDLDVILLSSELGVAENGAIWISNEALPFRVSPFIAKHLAIIIPTRDIVPYMHQAYNKLDSMEYDYGVFISGPSKTADIEQSLVIGAHGALSLTIFLHNLQS